MKRKIILIMLCLAMVLCFTGCKTKQVETVPLDMAKVVENVENVNYAEGKLFNSMTDMPAEDLKMGYKIDTELMEEYVIRFPLMNVQSSLYMVIKPKEGEEETVKTQVTDFLSKYESQWLMYLPEQYDLVENALVTEEDGYLIVIVSYDNNAALEAILSSK